MKSLPLLLLACLCAASTSLIAKPKSKWIPLFDGTSLAGWKANENPDSWAIEEGAIVTRGNRSHLFYAGEVAEANFKNFELRAEVMTEPGSNSGIYIHTTFQDAGWPADGYECQVANSNPEGPSNYIEHKMTGSIYAVRNTWQSPARDGEWFDYRIRVQGKTIQTYIDGALICEYTEPESPWRPDDKKRRLLGEGTFALQAHDPGSVVRYRTIEVRLLPDDLSSAGQALQDSELDELITRFSNDNIPLIDIGVELNPVSLYQARKYGVSLIDADLAEAPPLLLLVTDDTTLPSTVALRNASSAGAKIVFSSGGSQELEPSVLRRRLESIQAAELGWKDFWVPGK
ncbi:DUF1080 domain-containing protein [Pelagicoccus sp. SDUM812003]|uniref:3-keto-disaccharide hydrolase n=1 Tax=Pelagicoccus sp. SDUM812003 TaxID=3041267 RepID=UPI00280C7B54|nr:DUF1080 domain-containing protein [Pelagicoccus sp. SDUM812003]MDQ8203241.1 DUF1080 domain-containing protein [Pelagicoccus sp. SDUM812003]